MAYFKIPGDCCLCGAKCINDTGCILSVNSGILNRLFSCLSMLYIPNEYKVGNMLVGHFGYRQREAKMCVFNLELC